MRVFFGTTRTGPHRFTSFANRRNSAMASGLFPARCWRKVSLEQECDWFRFAKPLAHFGHSHRGVRRMPLKSLTWKSGLAVKLISKSPDQTGGCNRCYRGWQIHAGHRRNPLQGRRSPLCSFSFSPSAVSGSRAPPLLPGSKAGPRDGYADAVVAAPLKKASKSALIWSALVAGMP
jgi:hypothetical protein